MSDYYLYIGLILAVIAFAQLGAEYSERKQLARKRERIRHVEDALRDWEDAA